MALRMGHRLTVSEVGESGRLMERDHTRSVVRSRIRPGFADHSSCTRRATMPLGPTELTIVLVIVMFLFGAGKLPEVGGALGRSIKEFRQATSEEPKEKGDS